MANNDTPQESAPVTASGETEIWVRGATVNNAERVPGSGLDRNSSINVDHADGEWSDWSINKTSGDLKRDVTFTQFHNLVSVSSGSASTGQREHFTQVTSAPVVEAGIHAIQRALSNGELSPKEAVQLEKFRQEVAAAVVNDGRIDGNETQALVRRAARIAPEGREH